MKINSLQKHKHEYLIHTRSDKAFQGIVVIRTLSSLNKVSLEITLTVTLKGNYIFFQVFGLDF